MALPVAQPGEVFTAQAAPEQQALTPEETAAVDALYAELKPQATETARNYVLNRTPAAYQEAMAAKIEADWPLPPVEDPAAFESRRRDALAWKRPADPNLPSGTVYAPPQSPLA
jgi:hypothetical protein